jgi:tetratricopeptide (TPR) repeat protein
MTDHTSNIPESFIEALEAKEVVPFIGAGVSLAVKENNERDIKQKKSLFPSWKEFLLNAADKLDAEKISLNNEGKSRKAIIIRNLLDDPPIDYLDIAQRAFDSLGEKHWYDLLTENFEIGVEAAEEKSLELPKLVWKLNNKLLVTTNIDLVLPSVHETPGRVKILDTQAAEFAELQKDWETARPTVLHLHGHIDNKANIVFTEDQYRDFYSLDKNRAKLETLRSLFTQRTILFIGFSLDDLFILKELERVKLIYEGRANYLFALIHEKEKDNPNIPTYVQKITFQDFGRPLIEKIQEILRLAGNDVEDISKPSPETPETALKNHFNVPFASKGEAFVGREGLREKIWESLDKGGRAAIGQAVNIRGIGGLGKTQLAVEYAYAFRERYENGVFWLTADKDLDTQLVKIGKDLYWIGNESNTDFDQAELVRNRFRKLSKCLIIFDNVDDLSAVENYIPEKEGHPHILITSREKQSGFHQIELDLLARDEARNLLLNVAGRKPESKIEKIALEEILTELEDLPLAVELVGGYLSEHPIITFENYRRFLLREPLDKLEAEFPEDNFTKHDKSIIRSLRISEKLLEKKPLMIEILDILAWSGKSFMGMSLLSELVGINDEFTLLNALSDAVNLRLIKKDENSERYSIHRLLARVRQFEKPLISRKDWHKQIAKRIENWFRIKNEESKTFSDAEIELDHLETWQRITVEYLPSEAVWLTVLKANPLMVRGSYGEAQRYVEEALDLYNKENLTDKLLLANLYNAISQPCSYLGNCNEAKSHIEKALDFYDKEIIDDKKLKSELLSNLGTTYGDLNDYQKALELQQQALKIRQELFGEKHPYIANSLSKVGYAFGEMGNHKQALELKQQALEMWQELFGERHSEIATSLNNLGLTYSQLGEHEKALELKQKALEMRKELFGEKHPYIANSLSNLGSTYIELGNRAEGLIKKEEALEMRRELFGGSHSYTIKTCRNLIKLHIKFGGADKAEILAAKYYDYIPAGHRDKEFFEEYATKYWKKKDSRKKHRG